MRRVLVLLPVALAVACGDLIPVAPSSISGKTAVLVGAGDIANCDTEGARHTARLLDAIDGIVFTAGDNAYPDGSLADYERCYAPTWGRHRARTRPAPGNHEYQTPGAAGYFAYYGNVAGPGGLGYYSFTAGDWLILSLNSNIPAGRSSPQWEWVRHTLDRSTARCAGAIWHHPIMSSGPNRGSPVMREIWHLLHDNGVDLVIVAHEHIYERYAPLDGDLQPARSGLRQFVVGTGGTSLYNVHGVQPGSQVQISAWGVLKLTLRPDRYDWAFIAADAADVRDGGSDTCR